MMPVLICSRSFFTDGDIVNPDVMTVNFLTCTLAAPIP
jgi:hypothetical protein